MWKHRLLRDEWGIFGKMIKEGERAGQSKREQKLETIARLMSVMVQDLRKLVDRRYNVSNCSSLHLAAVVPMILCRVPGPANPCDQ